MKKKVKIKDIALYSKGTQINGDELLEEAKFDYLNGGIKPSGKWDNANCVANTVTISEGGNSCGYVNFMKNPFWCGAHCYFLYDTKIDSKYLYYALKSQQVRIMKLRSGACMPNIKKTDLGNFEFVCDDNSIEQKKITHILDKLECVIEQRKNEIQVFDELVKARFIEVFGDMLLNSKSWREIRLDSVADIVSGITKGRKIKSAEIYEVPYMAVSNVKNGYIDWTKVKTIMATKEEIKRYQLLPNDVLMTEGGDPDKLGRGAIIKSPPNNCIHQNHIFRVRLNEEILPIYFEYYLQQIKAKRYFLKCSKQTTGIASINMKQLMALPVLIPDMESQKTFAKFTEQADKSKLQVYQCIVAN